MFASCARTSNRTGWEPTSRGPNPSSWQPRSTKLAPQTLHDGTQNTSKSGHEGLLEGSWGHLSPKMASKSGHEGLLEGSWAILAPRWLQNQAMRASWRALGAMLAPRWPQEPNKTTKRSPPDPQWTPKLEAKMEPKSIKNALKI